MVEKNLSVKKWKVDEDWEEYVMVVGGGVKRICSLYEWCDGWCLRYYERDFVVDIWLSGDEVDSVCVKFRRELYLEV